MNTILLAMESISNIDSDDTKNLLNENSNDYAILTKEDTSETPLHIISKVIENGYTNIDLVVESRWVESYKKLFDKYSSYLSEGEYNINLIPTANSKIQSKEVLREDYIDNKIYKVSDIVFEHSTGLYAEIIDRGSNYIRTVNQNGDISRCWLDRVSIESETSEIFLPIKNFYKGNEIFAEDDSIIEHLQESFTSTNDVYKTLQEVRSMNFLDTPYNSFIDQQRLARIFATALGILPENLPQDPKTTVDLALLKLPGLVLSPKGWDMISTFLEQINFLKIRYNKSYLNAFKQHLKPSLFVESVESPDDDCCYDEILDKFEQDPEFLEDEINHLSFDDIVHLYDEDELLYKNEEIKEAISFQERIARSIRFKRIQPILQQRRQLALKRASTAQVAAGRARKMAIQMIKNRLLQGRTNVPPSEKARIENIIKMRRQLVSRTATKLVPKIKHLETNRIIR